MRFEELPEETFLAVPIAHLEKSSLLWRSHALPADFDVAPYAFVVASDVAKTQIFAHAERYGGAGLAGNNGGVRCLTKGPVQVKGVGRTNLAGRSTDYWHKEGSLSLQDCVREAIWSEVIDSATPHGSASALGIIDAQCTFEGEISDAGRKTQVPRGLFLRVPVARVAHFMRSPYADSQDEGSRPSFDVRRTAAACSKLFGRAEERQQILQQLVSRIAQQQASMWALKLFHGSLIPSNIGIGGQLLDFGTTTALASYAKAVITPGGDDFWAQDRQVLTALEDLTYYIERFCDGRAPIFPGERQVAIVRDYLMRLAEFRGQCVARLFGFTWNQIASIPIELLNELWVGFYAYVGNFQAKAYRYYGLSGHAMYLPSGASDVNFVVRVCAASCDLEVCIASLVVANSLSPTRVMGSGLAF